MTVEVSDRVRPDSDVPDEAMRAIDRECEELGYRRGDDFSVWGVPADLSSEVVRLGKVDGEYIIWYQDMGLDRELFRSTSGSETREAFLLEVARLAAPRGRGPYAGRRVPSPLDGLTLEEKVARILQRRREP
jgi:hypothetical protein